MARVSRTAAADRAPVVGSPITDRAGNAHQDLKPTFAVLVVLLLWASAFIAIRAVADEISPGPLALGRLTVAAVVLSLLLVRTRLRHRPDGLTSRTLPRGRAWWPIVGYGVLWFAAYTVVLNAAEHHLDAGTAAMLVNIGPLLVAVAAGVIFGEGFPAPLVVGIVIAFVGVMIIALGGVGAHSDGLGIALGVVSAALYAAGVLTQKVALRNTDALTATWLGVVIGTIACAPFAPAAITELSHASVGAVLAVVYLGVFPTAIAFTLWAYALRRTAAGRTASASLAVPALVIGMSALILDELPTGMAVLGGLLALAGVAISRHPGRRRP